MQGIEEGPVGVEEGEGVVVGATAIHDGLVQDLVNHLPP